MSYEQFIFNIIFEGVLPGTNVNPLGINKIGGKRLKLHKFITNINKTNKTNKAYIKHMLSADRSGGLTRSNREFIKNQNMRKKLVDANLRGRGSAGFYSQLRSGETGLVHKSSRGLVIGRKRLRQGHMTPEMIKMAKSPAAKHNAIPVYMSEEPEKAHARLAMQDSAIHSDMGTRNKLRRLLRGKNNKV